MTAFPAKPAPPLPTRRWLKPDEAADYLGMSRSEFDLLVREGHFIGSRVRRGSHPRYDVRHLDAVMEARHGNSGSEDG